MRLLVTGGAGFVGSNFVCYMLPKYHEIEIANLGSLSYSGRLEHLLDVKDDVPHLFSRKHSEQEMRGNIKKDCLSIELKLPLTTTLSF